MYGSGVLHDEVTKIVLIRCPAKFVYVGGVNREHIVVHRNGQAGVDIEGELNGLLAGKIPREVEFVSEVIPTVDR